MVFRKKIILMGSIVIFCLGLCGCSNKFPKDDAFFETYLFSDYSGIAPQETHDANDYGKDGVIGEDFAKDTDWEVIEEYGRTLENLGFEGENVSTENPVILRYIKENSDNNKQTYDIVFVVNYGQSMFEDTIDIQVQYAQKDRPPESNLSDNNDKEDNNDESVGTTGETLGERNALNSAILYLQTMAFSRQGLIDQLEYEGYTNSEATYAVNNCGADWYEQAVLSAKEYLDGMPFSRQGLIEQLEYEGFTHDQAVYGVEQNGY